MSRQVKSVIQSPRSTCRRYGWASFSIPDSQRYVVGQTSFVRGYSRHRYSINHIPVEHQQLDISYRSPPQASDTLQIRVPNGSEIDQYIGTMKRISYR